MKIKAIAPWYGSKRTLASKIVAALGDHRAYWEPFCGSLAVLLAKPTCSQETVNDLHGDLVNLARVLRRKKACEWLYDELVRTLPSEGLFQESRAWLADHGNIVTAEDFQYYPARAYHFMIASWLGRNGVIGSRDHNNTFCVRYTSNGGIQGTRFASAVDSIPAWHRRLREVTILCRDAFTLLERMGDDARTAIYCDPPYLVKGSKYIHDFAPDDHRRLAELLQRFKRARVVVSYYDHPLLADLYPDWSRIDCSVTKSLVNQGKRDQRGAAKAPEVLLVNQAVSELF